jgi:CRP-like cAMP-binding protein
MSTSTRQNEARSRGQETVSEFQFHAGIGPHSGSAHRDQAEMFHGLGEQNVRPLMVGAQCRTYGRNQLVCKPDDDISALFIIGRGTARAYRLSPNGQEITIDTLVPGSVFGMRLAGPEIRSNNFVESTSDETAVYRIPYDRVVEIMNDHPGVAVSVLRLAYECLEDARDRLADLALYDVKTRLAHTLARLATRESTKTVNATHRELAWMVGTRPEEVTKALRHLRDAGLVAYQPRHTGITVPNPPVLAAYGEETV